MGLNLNNFCYLLTTIFFFSKINDGMIILVSSNYHSKMIKDIDEKYIKKNEYRPPADIKTILSLQSNDNIKY
jgi:hypothetical protein